eukprot:37643_1
MNNEDIIATNCVPFMKRYIANVIGIISGANDAIIARVYGMQLLTELFETLTMESLEKVMIKLFQMLMVKSLEPLMMKLVVELMIMELLQGYGHIAGIIDGIVSSGAC